jgi:hypothetical protein
VKPVALGLLGALVSLTVALPASAGSRSSNASPALNKAETCMRAALHKEHLALAYIRERKLNDTVIADKVIESAITDIKCARTSLGAAGSDEISPDDAGLIDGDMAHALVADVEAKSSLSHHEIGHAITELERANQSKAEALAALEKAATRPPKPQVSPIFAVFLPPLLATKYSVNATPRGGAPLPSFRWTLTLKQIDPDKSSPAGFQSSDPLAPNYASAGLDPGCNNSLLPNGQTTTNSDGNAAYVWSALSNEFTWFHGDKGAYPGSTYGCDHTKMGERGHQGIVTVKVTEGNWVCTASIDGTNLNASESTHGDEPICKYNP